MVLIFESEMCESLIPGLLDLEVLVFVHEIKVVTCSMKEEKSWLYDCGTI